MQMKLASRVLRLHDYEIGPVFGLNGTSDNNTSDDDYESSAYTGEVCERGRAIVNNSMICDAGAENHGVYVSPLHLAARLGEVSVCRLLLEFRVDVNANVHIRD